MRPFHRFFPALLSTLMCFAPALGHAQTAPSTDAWLLQSMAPLSRNASFHTDFTFNRQMLGALGGIAGDADTQRILDRLESVTVHLYRYPEPGLYDPAVRNALAEQYHLRGWMHWVAVTRNGPVPAGGTDLWIHYEHGNVEGMTLLNAEPQALNLVEVNGVLSPVDLLHLRGHFGIPRFSANHFTDDSGRQFPAEGH